MSFLAPFYLALAAAAAVPLLIHLLRRHIGTRVSFPAVRYLARAEQEHSRSLRLRNLLLMVLRVAIVLLLALAAARPFVGVWGGGHAATGVAIVFDNSMSTAVVVKGRPEIDRLRDAALSVIAGSTSADRLWLVTADGVVRGGTRAGVESLVRQLRPLASAGDIAIAMRRAAATVRSARVDARRLVVLTDGQRTEWRAAAPVGDLPVAVWAPDDTPPPNRAVVLAEPRPLRWSPTGAVAVRVSGADTAAFRVSLGSRTVARGTTTGGAEATVAASPGERGWLTGRVELEPDELPLDDTRWFAVWVGSPPGVTTQGNANPFITSALDVLRGSRRITSGGDVAVGAADAVSRTPALLVAPDDPVRVGAANRALERMQIPWRFGEPVRTTQLVRGVRPDSTLDGTTVHLRYALRFAGGAAADTLAIVGREPWVVGGAGYVLIASPLDPAATDLPLRAAWVPWLASALVERLGGDAGRAWQLTPGASIARPVGVDALEMPDGRRVAVGDTIAAPPDPGVYYLQNGGRRVGALVVNPQPTESDLARLALPALLRAIPGTHVEPLVLSLRESAVWNAPARRPLVAPILFIAMALLTAEAVLARSVSVRTS